MDDVSLSTNVPAVVELSCCCEYHCIVPLLHDACEEDSDDDGDGSAHGPIYYLMFNGDIIVCGGRVTEPKSVGDFLPVAQVYVIF